MTITQRPTTRGGARQRHALSRLGKPIAVLALGFAMVMGVSTVSAQADDVDLTPGPHIIADPNSPTGYTGHFVYYNPTATSVRFAADILLRDWDNPTSTTIYQPQQFRPGLMRGGGGYDVQMTNAGGGYWYTDVPLAAGANQYWFYVNNDTNNWIADPANAPIYAPDGLTGSARRAFNKVFVPYDAAKQNYAPLAARQIELYRPKIAQGSWSYVPITIAGASRTIGVYLPPSYDPNRAQPYKTIYMQHGSGQDQSDWLNMGDVPVIMDNLIYDGTTEPAVVITTNSVYMGAANQGYPNLRNTIIPFVESNYHVSTQAQDRAFAGLSAGAAITSNLVNFDATKFGYYGVFSGGVGVRNTTTNVGVPYILFGGGAWDFGLPNPTQVSALTNAHVKNVVVAGAHDFNTWDQLFTTFARDYIWQPGAWDLKVSATASVRCVAGKASVYVTATNGDANATENVSISSAYGTASVTGIATGKNGIHSFTTRLASVPAGSVTVNASATVQGDAATGQATASYPATTCN